MAPTAGPQNRSKVKKLITRINQRVVELAGEIGSGKESVAGILVSLSQVAAAVADDRRRGQAPVANLMESVLTDLSGIAARHPTQAKTVAAVIEDLNQVAIDASLWKAEPRQRQRTMFTGGQTDPRISYTVRQKPSGSRLVESRRGNPKDFSISEKDYHAGVEAIALVAERPAKLDDIHFRFCKEGGSRRGSRYPLRVLLRFFRWLDPPLVIGSRGTYRIAEADAEHFKSQAVKAWRDRTES